MDRWANSPRFEITVEGPGPKWPDAKHHVWHRYHGMHVAAYRDDPFVSYFHSDGKPTEGFGGRPFDGTFTDGSEFHYRGAWSSRAACVNQAFLEGAEGFPLVVDVVCGSCSTAVKASALIDWWLDHLEVDWGLAFVDDGDVAPILLPTRNGKLKDEKGSISKILTRKVKYV
jgi:hypothetical protein